MEETLATEAENIPQAIEAIEDAAETTAATSDAVIGAVLNPNTPEQAARLQDLVAIGESTVYLMGLSFIIGSLFTILILLVFDFMRRNAKR